MSDFNWNVQLPLRFGLTEAQQMHLVRALPDAPQRGVFEAFIQQRFRRAHGADVRHFMPQLFGMSDASGTLCAVVGVRLASGGPLFLEGYLDETTMAERLTVWSAATLISASIVSSR